MKKENQKMKILYLQDIFTRMTDENNIYDANEICDILLSEYGISAERKSIYDDIESLRKYGMDIVNVRTPKRGYYLKGRKFEPAEIRLLTDAVVAARFIPKSKTELLVQKISSFLSAEDEKKLARQVYVNSSFKCDNEELYEVISTLDKAIQEGVQVQFDYSRRKLENRFVKKSKSRTFVVNPYALIWSNDHYYLVCNNPKYDNLMHTRLDRMSNIVLTNTPRRHFSFVSEYKDYFDSADYSNKLFNMFSGDSAEIQLLCNNRIIDEILERFGENVPLKTHGADSFIVKANVDLSEGLVSWIMQFGGDIQVVEPVELKTAVKDRAKAILQIYE